jgi:hypothetical protein
MPWPSRLEDLKFELGGLPQDDGELEEEPGKKDIL